MISFNSNSAQLDTLLNEFLSLHPKSIDLSLDRLLGLLQKLGNPHLCLPPVIHIAGTNGKGSVLATLRSLLEAHQKTLHIYTSPHLVRFNERIRLADHLIEDEPLIAAFEKIKKLNDGAPITFFEITSAAAYELFAHTKADYTLLETGLGGRYDTTNVIPDPALTIITPISMDHTEFLGDTIAKIAGEKAGIIKPNVPLILTRQQEEARNVILEEAAKKNAPVFEAGVDFDGWVENGRLLFQTNESVSDFPLPNLLGDHQIDNALLALAAFNHIISEPNFEQTASALTNIQWPARLQRLKGALTEPLNETNIVWLDGGHNVSAASQIAQFFQSHCPIPRAPFTLILGMLNNKDCAGYLSAFKQALPHFNLITLQIPNEPNAHSASDILEIATQQNIAVQEASSIENALKIATTHTHTPTAPHHILIGGSLYLAGHVLAHNKTPPT